MDNKLFPIAIAEHKERASTIQKLLNGEHKGTERLYLNDGGSFS